MFSKKEGIIDREDITIMRPKELRRISIINRSIGEGLVTQVKAVNRLLEYLAGRLDYYKKVR